MPFGPRLEFLFSLLFIFAVASFEEALAAEGDPQRGREKSVTCVACHGQNGISPAPEWPNLAGQKEQYFILQMQAYKSGERRNDLMSPIVVPLTDQDIRDLAAYYAQLKP